MPNQEDEMIEEQADKHEALEERIQKTRDEIIETYRQRKISEKDFLEIIENQKKYWESQLNNTDPQKDKERYNELKEKIKNEERFIVQIEEELTNLDKGLSKEKEHEEAEEEHKNNF